MNNPVNTLSDSNAGFIWKQYFDESGFGVTDPFLAPLELAALWAVLDAPGRGDLFALEPIRDLARHPRVRYVAEAVLGPGCFAVRALFFDKAPASDWRMAWHQDLTISVRQRVDVPGFGPWSTKGGALHVQAPAEVLEQMVAVRVHLDASDAGPLRVLPGTHRFGRLSPGAIDEKKTATAPMPCAVQAGGLVVMRPLLLHAISSSTPEPSHVLHFEFARAALPGGLEWAHSV